MRAPCGAEPCGDRRWAALLALLCLDTTPVGGEVAGWDPLGRARLPSARLALGARLQAARSI